MGTSVAISLRSMLRRGSRRVYILLKVLKRTAILFALGLMISNMGGKSKILHITGYTLLVQISNLSGPNSILKQFIFILLLALAFPIYINSQKAMLR